MLTGAAREEMSNTSTSNDTKCTAPAVSAVPVAVTGRAPSSTATSTDTKSAPPAVQGDTVTWNNKKIHTCFVKEGLCMSRNNRLLGPKRYKCIAYAYDLETEVLYYGAAVYQRSSGERSTSKRTSIEDAKIGQNNIKTVPLKLAVIKRKMYKRALWHLQNCPVTIQCGVRTYAAAQWSSVRMAHFNGDPYSPFRTIPLVFKKGIVIGTYRYMPKPHYNPLSKKWTRTADDLVSAILRFMYRFGTHGQLSKEYKARIASFRRTRAAVTVNTPPSRANTPEPADILRREVLQKRLNQLSEELDKARKNVGIEVRQIMEELNKLPALPATQNSNPCNVPLDNTLSLRTPVAVNG